MSKMNTLECLRALVARTPDARNQIVGFMGAKVKPFNVDRWVRGNHAPWGMSSIKLRVYLSERGFSPSEWESLNPIVFDFARYVAHGHITVEKASRELFPQMKDQNTGLFALLLNRRRASDALIAKMKELMTDPTLEPLVARRESADRKDVSLNPILVTLAGHVKGLGSIGGILDRKEFTPEECKAFRAACGTENLVRISAIFNRLVRC